MRFLACFIAVFSSNCLFAKDRELPLPNKGATMDTLESLVEGVIRHKNRVFLTLFARGMYIQVPFNGITDDQKKTFGEFADSKRIPMEGSLARALWQGGDTVDGKVVLIDGDKFQMAVFDQETGLFLGARTIPWDLIRPPRDRGGEPTKAEVAEYRSRFLSAYKLTDTPRIAGMAYDRYKWLGKDKHHFFVGSRLKGIPLLVLACELEDPSACYVDRGCFVEGGKIDGEDIGGVAVGERRRLYLLDSRRGKIIEYDFKSCFHVAKRGELALPDRIKKPSDVYVDEDNALWVSSRQPDDYYNASVFLWLKKDWQP